MKENIIYILMVALAIVIFYFLLNPLKFLPSKLKGDDYLMLSIEVSDYANASFSGGCFWCMEPPFEKLPGVVEVIVGYTGGKETKPTYQDVVSGRTGHRESIQVYYDPGMISYETLLEVFWMSIDPTDSGGQFADRGNHYKTAIWYSTPEEKITAELSKEKLSSSGIFKEPIVTEILEAKSFYQAENYHQDYYIKSASHYEPYNIGSGRKKFLEDTWGKEKLKYQKRYPRPIDSQIKKKLTPLQFKVTQENGTEPPFDNLYWDNKDAEGIYVDVVSGEPLFSSKDMIDSGTGWPSFTRPLIPMHFMYKKDTTLLEARTEVRSKFADSHLGHVFEEESSPTGKRYCINSAALRFIPKEDLVNEGYGTLSKGSFYPQD